MYIEGYLLMWIGILVFLAIVGVTEEIEKKDKEIEQLKEELEKNQKPYRHERHPQDDLFCEECRRQEERDMLEQDHSAT